MRGKMAHVTKLEPAMQDFEGHGKGMDFSISIKAIHEEVLSWGVNGQSGYSVKNRLHGTPS